MGHTIPDNSIKMYGILEVFVKDQDGNLKRKYKFHNDIVSNIRTVDGVDVPNGTALITSMLTNRVRQGIGTMRIGKGTTPTTDNTYELTTPVPGAFQALPVSNTTTQAIIQFYTLDAQLPNDTYHEFGFFVGRNALFARVVNATGVEKVSGENILWQYTVNVTKS